jgi:thioesterase domain-containing protein
MSLPKNVDDLYQLTPMQHLMLLRAIGEEGGGVLLNQMIWDIRGPLDVAAFKGAWEAVVRRHPALRTAFLWEGLPHPVQVIRSAVALDFSYTDLSTLPAGERAREAARREGVDASTPLRIERAPLMRCHLLRLEDDHHRFLWSVHHLVIDRWSHTVLFSEVRDAYVAHRTGASAFGAPAPAFRDYVAWIARQDRGAAARYWQEVVGDVREPTRLGASTGQQGASRVTTRHPLAAATSEAVRMRAAQWRVTPGAVLQAAIGLLLAQRSGRADVVFGLTVSGRPPDLADAAGGVGSYVNNIPVRLRFARDETLASVVREVHRGEGRRMPFTWVSPIQIHEWSSVPPGRALFDTLVLLNVSDDTAVEWPGLEFVTASATLDAGYPFLLAIGVQRGTYAFTLVHEAGFEGAAQVLAELDQVVARLATVDDAHLVRDVMPESLWTARPVEAPAAAFPPATGATTSRAATAGVVMADALLQAWRDILGIADVGLDDDFLALGGTSLQAAQLFARIERITTRALPLSTLLRAGSVRAILAELDQPVTRAGSLVRLRTAGHRPPLHAVPGIGGNVIGLSGLARHLGADRPFSAFESPGLDGREAPLESIEAIASRYVAELLQAESGPLHLLGICWGAAVAFEMAHQLGARGRPVASLALMDPAALLRESPAEAARFEGGFVRKRLELYWDEFREGNWRDRSRMLAQKARRVVQVVAGGEAQELSAQELHRVRVLEANTRAVATYQPRSTATVARIFLTTDRTLTDGQDPRLEWLALVTPTPEVVGIGGINSGDAIAPAHVGGFAGVLRSWLESRGPDT